MAMRTCPGVIIPKELTDPTIRYLTVSHASSSVERERVPALILRGKWLEAAGFPVGTVVDVWISYGCLVLTARKADEDGLEEQEEPEEHEEPEEEEEETVAMLSGR